MHDRELNLEWYKKHFIANERLNSQEIAVYAGINKKTICNIYGSETREIVLEVAQGNIDYPENLLNALGESADIGLCLKITYKNISVELNLNESLLVINALATKKIALRGGAWSSVGKKIEKPLMLALCQKCGVRNGFCNAESFSKDKRLGYDREVDLSSIIQTKANNTG